MKITDYDLLVLQAFDSLKKNIAEAEEYTVEHYNTIIKRQQAEAEQAKAAQAVVEPQQVVVPKQETVQSEIVDGKSVKRTK